MPDVCPNDGHHWTCGHVPALVRSQIRLHRNVGGNFFNEDASAHLRLPAEVDEDFGYPEVITITVEPRDTLNPPPIDASGGGS